MNKAPSQLYQLKVTLKHSKPPIWRRLLVRPDLKLAGLHDVLQIAMGWHDCHLHDFEANGTRYGVPDPEFGDDDLLDESLFKLNELLTTEKQKIRYTYDFGDFWQHDIVLEKILTVDSVPPHAKCVAGKLACPPEDCGGIGGYEELLRIVVDPKHPDHDDMCDWLPEDFDPFAFSMDAINAELMKLR
ncbi:MAG: plasmid pRiA4b ORF-3 family protein [Permianibacter sp.]